MGWKIYTLGSEYETSYRTPVSVFSHIKTYTQEYDAVVVPRLYFPQCPVWHIVALSERIVSQLKGDLDKQSYQYYLTLIASRHPLRPELSVVRFTQPIEAIPPLGVYALHLEYRHRATLADSVRFTKDFLSSNCGEG